MSGTFLTTASATTEVLNNEPNVFTLVTGLITLVTQLVILFQKKKKDAK